jgi:hypothetical protein
MSARPVQPRNITPSFAHTSMRLHDANPRALIHEMNGGVPHSNSNHQRYHANHPYNGAMPTYNGVTHCQKTMNRPSTGSCLHYVMNPDPFDHSTHPMESRIFDAAAATAAAGAFTMAGMGARKYFDS